MILNMDIQASGMKGQATGEDNLACPRLYGVGSCLLRRQVLRPNSQSPNPTFATLFVVGPWRFANLLMPQFHLLKNGDKSWTFFIE